MAKPTFPFLDMDVTKLMGDFRLPGFDVDGLVALQKKNAEALAAANQLAVEGVQAAMKQQAEMVRQAFEDANGLVNEMLSTAAPEDRLARQTDLAKATFEKNFRQARELADVVAKSNALAAELVGKRVVESLDEMKAIVAPKRKPAATAKAA